MFRMVGLGEKTFFIFIFNNELNNKLYFIIWFDNYGEDIEIGKYSTSREITPINDRDFLNWLYEFIVYFGFQPVAYDENIKERVEKLIKQNGEENRINWNGEFQYSKEIVKEIKSILSEFRYTRKDIVDYFKSRKIDFSERTLRFYENEGLLPKPERKRGRTKLYNDQIFGSIEKILYLKNEGKTLRDIKKIMNTDSKTENTVSI